MARAERYLQQGDSQIAAEYEQFAHEAVARAERYRVLADVAEKSLGKTLPTARNISRFRVHQSSGDQAE